MLRHDRAAILLLSGTLALMNVACSRVNSLWRPDEAPEPVAVSSSPSPAANPPDQPTPAATPTSQPPLAAKDAYERALDAAYSAATISQSAESSEDWQLVSSRWKEAIELLRIVPASSSYHAIAQQKIAEYQRNLGIAQQQASRPRPASPLSRAIATAPRPATSPASPSPTQAPSTPAPATEPSTPTPATEPKTNTSNPRVFKAPIKRRLGRTPVIEVTFNGGQAFDMVVDTGASGTVITKAMAQSLGVVPEGKVLANTASNQGVKFLTGRVQSIAVAGAVEKNVQVAIAGPELELGLLGQDFYGKYDIWIRQDVVEFHPRI
jgi:predicted aspartyl protease